MNLRLALTGFGNVGQGLATLLSKHGSRYEQQYGVRIMLTGVADRGGAIFDTSGLDLDVLLRNKAEHKTVAGPGGEGPVGDAEQFLASAEAMVLVEAASTNFQDAEPGLSYVLRALERSMDVVLASKGSLALHYGEVMEAAASRNASVLFSATVGAPIPSLQIADRGLIGAEITGFAGILNGTTHQILDAMSRGLSYQEGVEQAQRMGIAETDPTLDVDGWDAAAKVAIVSNAVFGSNLSIHDVRREGIRGVTAADLEAAKARGEAIKLIARATNGPDGVRASVAPEPRKLNDALGRLAGDDMGIVFDTEPLGKISSTVESSGHGGGISTAMTILRDVLNLARDRGWAVDSR
ncbi:MAG: homoserine dehydrogenase [Chloroflexota bacterium]